MEEIVLWEQRKLFGCLKRNSYPINGYGACYTMDFR